MVGASATPRTSLVCSNFLAWIMKSRFSKELDNSQNLLPFIYLQYLIQDCMSVPLPTWSAGSGTELFLTGSSSNGRRPYSILRFMRKAAAYAMNRPSEQDEFEDLRLFRGK
ncbi:MAG TPA: hypothetical protein VGX23_23485 [Actinocrinis sp.]|nr:hypothetical protein [Actinocrinis sp.]